MVGISRVIEPWTVTFCPSAADTDEANSVDPEYLADSACVPAPSAESTSAAWPVAPRVTVPRLVPESSKVTDPLGTAVPLSGITVAVRMI